ncbi:hypothetical protein, partial [Burkholderia pseudomallei]|uniref:hypothetical protein n=1 Tax=Burkholderia pseudomallei TaxID=28450 RepID=UPI001C4BAAFD
IAGSIKRHAATQAAKPPYKRRWPRALALDSRGPPAWPRARTAASRPVSNRAGAAAFSTIFVGKLVDS